MAENYYERRLGLWDLAEQQRREARRSIDANELSFVGTPAAKREFPYLDLSTRHESSDPAPDSRGRLPAEKQQAGL